MGRNFLAMPQILKLLTAAAAVLPLFFLASTLPHTSIGLFGRQLTTAKWWSTGMGLTTIFAASVMCIAAFLMLRRSIYGRPAYILAWVTLSFSIPLAAHLTGTETAALTPLFVSNLLLTSAIGAYLYLSASVRGYFDPVSE
jgi:hypothetical protein